MKKNTSWKFTDELSVTFQSSVSGAGEFGPIHNTCDRILTRYCRSKTTCVLKEPQPQLMSSNTWRSHKNKRAFLIGLRVV